jgi:hypothetical protein
VTAGGSIGKSDAVLSVKGKPCHGKMLACLHHALTICRVMQSMLAKHALTGL